MREVREDWRAEEVLTGEPKLWASLGHSERRVVLGHMFNTL